MILIKIRCGKSIVIENKSKNVVHLKGNISLPPLLSSNIIAFLLRNYNTFSTTNKTFKSRTPQSKEENYIYIPKSFNLIEKLFDNGIDKQFRANNTIQIRFK